MAAPLDPFHDRVYWVVIRTATQEPLFPEPVMTKHEATVMARGRLRLCMKRDDLDGEMHYGTRSDAQVDALLARDYVFRRYRLVEIKK